MSEQFEYGGVIPVPPNETERLKARIAELEAANLELSRVLRAVKHSMDTEKPFPSEQKITDAINLFSNPTPALYALCTALKELLQLADTPEHAQDDEWYKKRDEIAERWISK